MVAARPRRLLGITLGGLGLAGVALTLLGRVWWCQSGDLSPWSWDIMSRHNSQHLMDPYTFSHIQHGLIFYALGRLILPRSAVVLRYLAAMGVEVAWEILENTAWIIERYRETTISLEYYGDSILNSLADILAAAAGYGLAATLPVLGSALILAAIEILMLLAIRDSLLINIIMLIRPLDSLRRWQSGG